MIRRILNIGMWCGIALGFGWYVHTSWLLKHRPQFPDPARGLEHRLVEHGTSIFVGQGEYWLHQLLFPAAFLLVAAGIVFENLRVRRKIA